MDSTRAGSWAGRGSVRCSCALMLVLLAATLEAGRVDSVSAASLSPAGCDRVASPRGKNGWRGTLKRPYRTVNKLVRHLRPGQTGCLRRGNYYENVSMRRGGRRKRRLVLRSFPGEGARVIGRFWVSRRARYVTVRGLWLDGRNRTDHPSPTVNASGVRLVLNDITNRNTAICVLLGDAGGVYGRADGARVERNRIHNCGHLPATNLHHGIYVEAATGALIRDNWIYDNADYGLHLYPDAQHTLVTGNVVHDNGAGLTFAGEHGAASNHNRVERNLFSASGISRTVESYWPVGTPVGIGNTVRRNCLFDRAGGDGILSPPVGFIAVDNLVARPSYVNERGRDLRLRRGTRCSTLIRAHSDAPGPSVRPPRLRR
jgi:nitrous oxidase accessory protein NosD